MVKCDDETALRRLARLGPLALETIKLLRTGVLASPPTNRFCPGWQYDARTKSFFFWISGGERGFLQPVHDLWESEDLLVVCDYSRGDSLFEAVVLAPFVVTSEQDDRLVKSILPRKRWATPHHELIEQEHTSGVREEYLVVSIDGDPTLTRRSDSPAIFWGRKGCVCCNAAGDWWYVMDMDRPPVWEGDLYGKLSAVPRCNFMKYLQEYVIREQRLCGSYSPYAVGGEHAIVVAESLREALAIGAAALGVPTTPWFEYRKCIPLPTENGGGGWSCFD
jgi:hypothetical protein